MTPASYAARAMALIGVTAILVYPARALLVLELLPLAVRLCWPVAALAGLAAPRVSVLAFICC